MQLLSSRRWRAAAASAAVLALVLTGCSSEDSFTYTPPAQVDGALPDDMVATMQSAVDNALAASGASGAIVGVWAPWSGSWVTAVGTQDRDGGGELTTDMSFRIADVTRLMTCDVLYALADEGTVKLDALVPKYVSGVGNTMKEITLLDLCNGTSGAGSSESTVKSAWMNTPERVWAPLELAGYGLSRPGVAPHTTFRDSDAGYLILGLALERASGLTASELIAKYVTDPLDLADTSLPDPAPAAPGADPMKGHYLPAVEGGFTCAAPVDISKISSTTGYTDSGVVSTIDDLGRYIQAEAQQALRTKEKPDRFGAPLPVSEKSPSWYQATGGAYLLGSMIGQHGWVPGYATSAYSDPATGFTVAVVLNDSTMGSRFAQQLSWELAAIASKAPAASGQTAPEFGLPFTAEQYHKSITDSAIACVPPAG